MKKSIPVFVLLLFIFVSFGKENRISNTLTQNNPLIVNGSFDTEKIDKIFGFEVDSIIIESVPSADIGRIEYQNESISKNEIFTRAQINELNFVSSSPNTECEIDISYFHGGNKYNGICILTNRQSTANTVCDDINISVCENSVYEGKLIAKNVKQSLYYFIDEYPKSGILCLNDIRNGVFSYKPTECKNDKFSYFAIDECGEISNSATVYISVFNTERTIKDGDTSECCFALENNLLSCYGNSLFAPNITLTKSEFLVSCMNSLCYTDLKYCVGAVCVFSDSDAISQTERGYISYAASHSIIESTGNFSPNENITRAEASSIFSKLLNVNISITYTEFTDETQTPEQYRESVNKFCSIGALLPKNGNIRPNEALTRKEYAIMFERLKSLYPQGFD